MKIKNSTQIIEQRFVRNQDAIGFYFLFMDQIMGYIKPLFTCSKSAMDTAEQYVKSV